MPHHSAPLPTLEETLRRAHAQFSLLSDVLDLQALGLERADHPLGSDASRAMAETCRLVREDVGRLLGQLPAAFLNWSGPTNARRRKSA